MTLCEKYEVSKTESLTLTLSASKWIFWYFRTLGHLNDSSFLNIYHRNLPIVPFNSELNSTHFWLKTSGLHKKLVGCPLGERVSKTLFPQKGIDKLVFNGECCLFFSTLLPSSVFTGYTIQVVIIWETEVFVM